MQSDFPIIRLQVEGMKLSIMQALTEQQALFDQTAREEVERFCSPENIRAVVREAVEREIRAAVNNEVEAYFRHTSSGRMAIREVVAARLDLLYPKEADDE